MKRLTVLLSSACLAGILAAPAAAADYTMILAHTLSDTEHPLFKTFDKIAAEIEEKSSGRIDVQHQSGGALGGDRELMESLLLGDVQFVPVSTSGAVQFVPEFAVFDIPYIFPSDTAKLRRILNDSEFTTRLSAVLEEKNLKFGGFYNAGFRNLTTSSVPVRTPDDIAKNSLRVRVMENPYHVEIWKSLGGAPTPISFPELYGALQQGVVDGQENPYGHILSQRFYEVQKYLTNTNHILLANVNLINKEWFDGLPEDLQQVVDGVLEDAETFQWSLQDEMTSAQREQIEGVLEVIDLTDEEMAAFRESTGSVSDMVRQNIGDELVDSLMQAVETN
ncbi:TRAP transporter substrate-binding protein [Nitratireductor luteus]|uniref:TRAP transporter substrate-binding protein n=1 Tax=Nitratireductor luteus TaxID=2976980 RepID=UPI002240604C|nr:TRAP transporter substrate-binding protein [Nitratireductor luteus]